MAYWCRKALVIRVESPEGETVKTLDKPFARIGSHRRCDVRIPGTAVRSGYLHATETGVFCVPLGPELNFHGWVDEERGIRCGSSTLWVSFRDQSPLLPGAHLLDDKLPYGSEVPLWEIRHKGQVVASRWQRRPLTLIGRSSACHLRIGVPSISDAHAVAYWDGRHVWVVDLCSTNGTRKQGVRFHVARLKPGREVSVAKVGLYFRKITHSTSTPGPSADFELGPVATPHDCAPPVAAAKPGDDPADDGPSPSPGSELDVDLREDRLAAWEARLLRFERELCRREAALQRRERSGGSSPRSASEGSAAAADAGPLFQRGMEWACDDSSVPP